METPWSTFEGYLKQLVHADLKPVERELFDFLFPRFEGDPTGVEQAHNQSVESGIEEKLGGLITLHKGDPRDRRFAGYNFPRSRYFSLAKDSTGDDGQTLAHELRAYRNPVDTGMVEVIDLAGGVQFKKEGIYLDPEPAIAVLIHEPQNLPERLQRIDFESLPGLQDSRVKVHRFPFKVKEHRIDRTIDLRFPDTRTWFFESFQVPLHHLEGWDFTTAYSRFHLEDSKPPKPLSFWEMLPTLTNPDLGGGNPGTTGSTLQSIGSWLRQNGCAALIYPSARADVSVIFEEGALVDWTGWNLVLYKNSPVLRGAKYVRIDPSPWAWVRLPAGVQLDSSYEGTKHAGSFALSGVVDHSAKDYLEQIQALKIARRIHGSETERGKLAAPSTSRAFMIGVLTVRWLRLALDQSPAAKVHDSVRELVGLTLPYGLYDIGGRVPELWSDLYEKGASGVGQIVQECLGVVSLFHRCLSEHHCREDLAQLLLVGYDVEFFLFCTSALLKALKAGSRAFAIPGLASTVTTNLSQCTTLGQDLQGELEAFYRQGTERLRNSPEAARSVLRSGVALVDRICENLRSH
jgi:hypothetical protein